MIAEGVFSTAYTHAPGKPEMKDVPKALYWSECPHVAWYAIQKGKRIVILGYFWADDKF